MGSVPNCRKEIPNRHAIRWFKCKLTPPKNIIFENTALRHRMQNARRKDRMQNANTAKF